MINNHKIALVSKHINMNISSENDKTTEKKKKNLNETTPKTMVRAHVYASMWFAKLKKFSSPRDRKKKKERKIKRVQTKYMWINGIQHTPRELTRVRETTGCAHEKNNKTEYWRNIRETAQQQTDGWT